MGALDIPFWLLEYLRQWISTRRNDPSGWKPWAVILTVVAGVLIVIRPGMFDRHERRAG